MERINFMSGVGGTRRSMWQLSPAFCDGALFAIGAASFAEVAIRERFKNYSVAQLSVMDLRLSVEDFALAVCFAVQPRLTDLGP
jgi:hypothetical protein